MKIKKLQLAFLFVLFSVTMSATTPFAAGADVSWLTQMEAAGKKFYNASGTQMECMALLKSLGINTIRLRVWVNPSDGWCNAQDLLAKAKRARDLGMRILIDFHYSDSWADPSKQTKPAAWTTLSLTDLETALANHTTDVLNLLKTNNVTPEWVQVGNETSNGMLWDTGRASMSMANYAALTNAGYDAVKSVFPSAKVIVHINNGYNNSLYQWIFDGLKNNGAKWDVIGMSLYPTWYTTPNDWQNCNISCLANMNNMVARYGKEVMIVECGMSWDSPTACNSFLTDLIAKTKSVTNGMGIGVIYWEPECYSNWSGYSLGAFDNSGKPTAALDAFKSVSGLTAVENPELKAFWDKKTKSILFNFEATNTQLCDASGKYILQIASAGSSLPVGNLQTGVYIVTANRLNENELYKFKVIVN